MAALDLFQLPRVVPGRIRQKILTSRLNGRYPQEPRATKPFLIDHPLGACMLVNRQAYEQLGGFDPGLHMYSEEIDLALRYEGAGWECWQVPSAEVIHLGGQSTRQMPDRMFVELWRSRMYIYSKHYSMVARLLLGLLLAVAQLWEALKTLVALQLGRTPREEARRRWKRAGATLRLVFRR
jgi:GT2 family glycosyltransferase